MPVGLSRDAITIARAASTVDADGDISGGLSAVLATRGTFGSPSYTDRQLAAQRGQSVEAVVALTSSAGNLVKDGDRLTVRGKTYVVVTVADVMHHFRLHLRLVS